MSAVPPGGAGPSYGHSHSVSRYTEAPGEGRPGQRRPVAGPELRHQPRRKPRPPTPSREAPGSHKPPRSLPDSPLGQHPPSSQVPSEEALGFPVPLWGDGGSEAPRLRGTCRWPSASPSRLPISSPELEAEGKGGQQGGREGAAALGWSQGTPSAWPLGEAVDSERTHGHACLRPAGLPGETPPSREVAGDGRPPLRTRLPEAGAGARLPRHWHCAAGAPGG